MHQINSKEQALLRAIHPIYQRIGELEGELEISGPMGDPRPRIEYFHDAVRAYSSGRKDAHEPGGRLSIEKLNYDLAMLRYIESRPLEKPQMPTQHHGGKKIALRDSASHEHKQALSEWYKHYALLFAALLSPAADKDHKTRTGKLNDGVEDLAALLADAKTPEQREKVKKKIQAMDKEIAGIEKAHLGFLAGKLAVYEESKSAVQALAGQGLNLAGQFVQGATQGAARGTKSRGR